MEVDGAGEGGGVGDSGVADVVLTGSGPDPHEGFAGEVDDAVEAREVDGLVGLPRAHFCEGGERAGVSGEADDGVVGGDGGGGEVTADETGGSGDPDVHGGSVGVEWGGATARVAGGTHFLNICRAAEME